MRATREPLRFAARELVGSGTASYRLRASGMTFVVRHGTRDVNIFNELFGGTAARLCYEPPRELALSLDANPAIRLLDLGANIGLFGLYALGRWPHATLSSYEPDPSNASVLRRVIAANGLADQWSVTEAAVSNSAGVMSFAAGLYSESRLLDEAEAQNDGDPSATGNAYREITVPVVDIFAQDHDVALVKMDIEGGEWTILGDPRLKHLNADAVVIEWHGRGCPEPDAHTAAVELLREAGYERLHEVEAGAGTGLFWAWRERRPASTRAGVAPPGARA